MIFHEFFYDPEVLTNSDKVAKLDGYFGLSKGRVIVNYPPRPVGGNPSWADQVIKKLASNSDLKDIEKMRGKERVKKLVDQSSGKVVSLPKRALYDQEKGWLENAIDQNTLEDCAAIITKNGTRKRQEFLRSEEDVDDGFLKSFPNAHNARRDEMVNYLACESNVEILLGVSRIILLVSPYFTPWKANSWPQIEMLLEKTTSRPDDYDISLKTNYVTGTRDTEVNTTHYMNKLQENADKYLRPCPNRRFTISRWKQVKANGEPRGAIHDRYLLCDKGGLNLGTDIQQEEDNAEEVSIRVISESDWDNNWKTWANEKNAFTRHDRFQIAEAHGSWCVTVDESVEGGS